MLGYRPPSMRSSLVLALSLVAAVTAASEATAAQLFRAWADRPGSAYLTQIARGPDGAMWFGDTLRNNAARIGRISRRGTIRHFALPRHVGLAGASGAREIVAGPGRALWFGAYVDRATGSDAAIGRITTNGHVKLFAVPSPAFSIAGVTRGPDGAIWFITKRQHGGRFERRIGRITSTGKVKEFALPTARDRHYGTYDSITSGPDGALWFTDSEVGKVGRITRHGSIKEFRLRGFWKPSCANSYGGHFTCAPVSIVAGPGRAMWFLGQYGNAIVQLSLRGKLRTHRVPPLGSQPTLLRAIAIGADHAVWFVTGSSIGRLTASGRIQQWRVSGVRPFAPDNYVGQLAAGTDRALWFIAGNKIGRIGV